MHGDRVGIRRDSVPDEIQYGACPCAGETHLDRVAQNGHVARLRVDK